MRYLSECGTKIDNGPFGLGGVRRVREGHEHLHAVIHNERVPRRWGARGSIGEHIRGCDAGGGADNGKDLGLRIGIRHHDGLTAKASVEMLLETTLADDRIDLTGVHEGFRDRYTVGLECGAEASEDQQHDAGDDPGEPGAGADEIRELRPDPKQFGIGGALQRDAWPERPSARGEALSGEGPFALDPHDAEDDPADDHHDRQHATDRREWPDGHVGEDAEGESDDHRHEESQDRQDQTRQHQKSREERQADDQCSDDARSSNGAGRLIRVQFAEQQAHQADRGGGRRGDDRWRHTAQCLPHRVRVHGNLVQLLAIPADQEQGVVGCCTEDEHGQDALALTIEHENAIRSQDVHRRTRCR